MRAGLWREAMRRLRLATPADASGLRHLIDVSVRKLSVGYYTGSQIEGALRYVFGLDTQLIADRTYYVIEDETGEFQAAGGWSRRRTLFGGDQMKEADDPALDPTKDAARIRAFFVHPSWSGRGLGRQLFDRCASDAARARFNRVELMATLPGEPFYRALGFIELDRSTVLLPDGEELAVVRMSRPLVVVPDSWSTRVRFHVQRSRLRCHFSV
jgi:GNAT superfamily N-acetyltransferase